MEKNSESKSPSDKLQSSLTSSTQIYASSIKKLTEDFESIVKLTTNELEVEQKKLEEDRRALEREQAKFAEERKAAEEIFGKLEDIVEINCGGHIFATYRSTLTKAPDSFLSALFSGRHPLTFDKKGRVFLDRNPEFFAIILDYLRTGYISKFTDLQKQDRFEIELEFFGIDLSPQVHKIFKGDKEFVFQDPMDRNGLFYYLGSLDRDTWSPPASLVKIESSTQGGSNLISIIDRVADSSVENLYSSSGPQWLSLTLEKGQFCPTGYFLKQENDRYLRNWEFQGATAKDRTTWVTIARYENDKTTQAQQLSKYWPVETTTLFQAFRIYVFGPSEKSSGGKGNCDFSIQQLELYGFYRG